MANQHDVTSDDALITARRRVERSAGWTSDYASRVVTEYLKFEQVALSNPMCRATPSSDIDLLWHEYEAVLEPGSRRVHHTPHPQDDDGERAFEETTTLYRTVFGEPPPDVWAARAKCHFDAPPPA